MNNSISLNEFAKSAGNNSLHELKVNLDVLPSVTTNTADDVFLREKLEDAKKQNGLIEKLTDEVKQKTGFGLSSKNIENSINEGKDSLEIEKDINNYKNSQANTAQGVGDVVSALASIFTLFKVKEAVQFLGAQTAMKSSVNSLSGSENTSFLLKIVTKFIDFVTKNKKAPIILGTIAAAVVGGFTKKLLLQANRTGTQQYRAETNDNMSDEEVKQAEKEAAKQKGNANSRNFLTGMINGLTAPILAIGGVIGAPFYVAINSLQRYFLGNCEDKSEKNLNSYVESIASSPVTNAVVAGAIMIPAIKSAKAGKIFTTNLEKAVAKLKDAKLNNISNSETSYKQLENILFDDAKINSIICNRKIQVSEKIKMLSDENIFAVKFKQIEGNYDELSKALKTECPVTRTIEEAKQKVYSTFNDEYTLERCVGVGTVAETYLAKDKNGKEVCIKMLKQGISSDKIEKDKNAVIEMIKNSDGKTNEQKEFLIKNFENIAQGVKKEVDLANEKIAAEALAKVTTKAKVVKPIVVKDNLYVMEKADGVCLQDLVKYLHTNKDLLKKYLKEYEESALVHKQKHGFESSFYTQQIQRYKADLKAYDEMDSFAKLSKEETQTLLEKYQKVMIEQFSKIDKDGKIIHGDIHPGNVFVDINALRAGKNDFLTLIDTGNTIQQDSQTALRFLNLSKYIKNADYENIAKFVLKDAKLPEGMNEQEAFKKISEELKTCFFDDKTSIGWITNDRLLSITDSIMQKFNIIPSDTQGNLLKSKTSATQSLWELSSAFYDVLEKNANCNLAKKGININESKELSKAEQTAALAEHLGVFKKQCINEQKFNMARAAQEKKNLKNMPFETSGFKISETAPEKNSEDYFTYLLKQKK